MMQDLTRATEISYQGAYLRRALLRTKEVRTQQTLDFKSQLYPDTAEPQVARVHLSAKRTSQEPDQTQ